MNERKRLLGIMGAPCGYRRERGTKVVVDYPSVDCDMQCEGCAWNPKEQTRRLESGFWVDTDTGIRYLYFDKYEEEEVENEV